MSLESLSFTPTSFRFKANFSPCLIFEIHHHDLNRIQDELIEAVRRTPKFFMGSLVIIDLEKITSAEKSDNLNVDELKTLLQSQGMIPVGVRGGSKEQQESAALVGLSTMNMNKSSGSNINKSAMDENEVAGANNVAEENKKTKSTVSSEAAKLITHPIRSGMQIFAKEGDLIVVAQVSSGAELIAAGHIHVYGSLRGRALAGAYGNKKARIFCRSLDAELISIAGHYLTKEDLLRITLANNPIQIYLENERLQVKALSS